MKEITFEFFLKCKEVKLVKCSPNGFLISVTVKVGYVKTSTGFWRQEEDVTNLLVVLLEENQFLSQALNLHLQIGSDHSQLIQNPSEPSDVCFDGLAHSQLIFIPAEQTILYFYLQYFCFAMLLL